jgi:predicted dithiol-disulfide oxidoreductase (DUF899 family)
MANQPTEPNVSAVRDAARPAVADRAAFQTALDRLRVREKAHTREGDAIAAARRRLPMVEVDPQTPLIGADGTVPLIDIFEGRSQLIAYFHMWHTGRPAAEQCEGCNFNTSHVTELSYLHSRDVSYAVFCEGAVRGGLAVPRLHGLSRSLVLGTAGLGGPVDRRPVLRHAGLLSPGR